MKPIVVPTINSNDTEAQLIRWLRADGEAVSDGDVLAVLETSKASFDLCAEGDGVVHPAAEAGRRYPFGATIGDLFADAGEYAAFQQRTEIPSGGPNADALVLTDAARALAAKHSISEAQLRSLGKPVLQSKDLAPFLAPQPTQTVGALAIPEQQRAIARVVTQSHATIPRSFVLKKVLCDEVLLRLGTYGQAERLVVGLPDFLVRVAASLPAEFPFFFGRLGDGLQFIPSTAGNIGVTFDLGAGLFIPVIRDAAARPLKEIARQMMAFRMKALRHTFVAEDLAGADLSISINMDADIVLVSPIIPPGQTCILSLSAVHTELAMDESGAISRRRFIHLGAAFDHRVINGFQANAFLNAIKARFDSPESVLAN